MFHLRRSTAQRIVALSSSRGSRLRFLTVLGTSGVSEIRQRSGDPLKLEVGACRSRPRRSKGEQERDREREREEKNDRRRKSEREREGERGRERERERERCEGMHLCDRAVALLRLRRRIFQSIRESCLVLGIQPALPVTLALSSWALGL